MERDGTILHFTYLSEILTWDVKWMFFRHVQLLSWWHASQRSLQCPELQGLTHWFLLEVLLYSPEKGRIGTEKHHLNAIYWSGQVCWGSHDKRVVGCCQRWTQFLGCQRVPQTRRPLGASSGRARDILSEPCDAREVWHHRVRKLSFLKGKDSWMLGYFWHSENKITNTHVQPSRFNKW